MLIRQPLILIIQRKFKFGHCRSPVEVCIVFPYQKTSQDLSLLLNNLESEKPILLHELPCHSRSRAYERMHTRCLFASPPHSQGLTESELADIAGAELFEQQQRQLEAMQEGPTPQTRAEADEEGPQPG
eukprot:scaffold238685_cov14-Tisochrysis_lutea.AAC.1